MSPHHRLISQLRPRVGAFVPRQTHPEWSLAAPWSRALADISVQVDKVATPDDEKLAKEYLLTRFFREAPIPKVQGLAEASGDVRSFLHKEMDSYLRTGESLLFRKEGELVGIACFFTWGRDDAYEVLEGDALAWHNAAAALARESASEVDPRVTWRDLQYQHIYNLIQRTLCGHPAKVGCVWAGPLSLVDRVRELGLSERGIAAAVRVTAETDLLLGTQTAFPGFERFLQNQFRRAVVMDEAKYADQEFEFEGVKVLRKLSKLGSTKFIFDLP